MNYFGNPRMAGNQFQGTTLGQLMYGGGTTPLSPVYTPQQTQTRGNQQMADAAQSAVSAQRIQNAGNGLSGVSPALQYKGTTTAARDIAQGVQNAANTQLSDATANANAMLQQARNNAGWQQGMQGLGLQAQGIGLNRDLLNTQRLFGTLDNALGLASPYMNMASMYAQQYGG